MGERNKRLRVRVCVQRHSVSNVHNMQFPTATSSTVATNTKTSVDIWELSAQELSVHIFLVVFPTEAALVQANFCMVSVPFLRKSYAHTPWFLQALAAQDQLGQALKVPFKSGQNMQAVPNHGPQKKALLIVGRLKPRGENMPLKYV